MMTTHDLFLANARIYLDEAIQARAADIEAISRSTHCATMAQAAALIAIAGQLERIADRLDIWAATNGHGYLSTLERER